jgi:Leucine-rich repeat (LRR) protein
MNFKKKLIFFSFLNSGLNIVPSILLQSTGSGKRISHLDLSHNQIVVIPSEIVLIENLSHLILSHNSICELPVEISRLRNLAFFDVSHNSISYLPTELGKEKKTLY